jgi:hypothetical protein
LIAILAIPQGTFAAQSDVVSAVNQIRLTDPNVPAGTPNPRGLVGTIIDNIFYPSGSGVKEGKILPQYLDFTGITLTDMGSQGTAGYIPKYTGAGITLGNSVIAESGGNIGIGTSTPSAKLEVVGTRTNTINYANAISRIGGSDVFLSFGALNGTPNYATWMQSVRSSDNAAFDFLINPNG